MKLAVEHKLTLVAALALIAGSAHADWTGKGEVGLVQASGNTQSSTLDAKLNVNDTWGDWKEVIDLSALHASSNNTETAQRYIADAQTNYALNPRAFWFGNAEYRDDDFSGFTYQINLTTGVGYKLIDSKTEKLAAQIGVGYGKLEYKTTGETKSNGVLTGGLDYENALTETTKLVDKFGYTGGSANQLVHNFIGLEVKMSTSLALSVGFDVQRNSNPPAPKKTTDELTTVNLVFGF